jgi:mannose-1-phosphate guanylyltransferase
MHAADDPIPGFYAVLPAGGPGSRLWPLSRTDRPKFLLDPLGNGRSLLQRTWDRLRLLTSTDRMIIVTGEQYGAAVAEQVPDIEGHNLLLEPAPRDTAAAIGFAAAVIAERDPAGILGFFPADHLVRDESEFLRAVREGVRSANAGYLTTIGIDPAGPSTAFGYIELGERLSVPGTSQVLRARRFVEKPDAETAARYLAEGTWRWNAGMFVVRADILLGELERARPELHSTVTRLAKAWRTAGWAAEARTLWTGIERVSIDYAVLEPAAEQGRVVVIPAALGWDDIGDWAALVDILSPAGALTPAVIGDVARVLAYESTGLVVAHGDRQIAVHGLTDVVIVDTPDVLLVTTRDRAQQLKRLVDELRRRGRLDLI